MVNLTLNGLSISVERGTTILEAAKFYGFPIPTLCHKEGLSPYGACRLCVVEIGEGPGAKLVSSCTYPVEEGMKVRTASERVLKARRIIIELLLASCPQSKVIQDIASRHNVRQQRFRQEHEDCILCGLCVRMCNADDGRSHRFSRTGQNEKPGHAFRHEIRRLPAVRRLHGGLPGLSGALHVQSAGKSDLRRLRQPCAAVHCEGSVPRYDVLHVTLRGL